MSDFLGTLSEVYTPTYQLNDLVEFVMYYMIAGYIKRFGLNPKLRSRHYAWLWIGFTLFTFLSGVAAMVLSNHFAVFEKYILYFYDRIKLPNLLRAVCFFMIFVKMPPFTSRRVNVLSSAAFGVYLIHDNRFVRPFLWNEVFKNASLQNSILLIPHSVIAVLLVYIAGTCMDLLRIYTLEKIYKKAVTRYAEQLCRPFKKIIYRIGNGVFGKE